MLCMYICVAVALYAIHCFLGCQKKIFLTAMFLYIILRIVYDMAWIMDRNINIKKHHTNFVFCYALLSSPTLQLLVVVAWRREHKRRRRIFWIIKAQVLRRKVCKVSRYQVSKVGMYVCFHVYTMKMLKKRNKIF